MHGGASRFTVALLLGLGIAVGCSGGGGGKGSPFPKGVRNIFPDFDDALRGGALNLPGTITCGGPIGNPFAASVSTNVAPIAGAGNNHRGMVLSATEDTFESRNPNGSGTITFAVTDSNDPGRLFVEIVGTFGAPKIRFLKPPIGAKEFLASDGTGQVFVVLTIERTIRWTRMFENDPPGVGMGNLVSFTGPPAIPPVFDGTISGEVMERQTFLVEFSVLAGPPTNTACIVNVSQIGAERSNFRDGFGSSVSFLVHNHDAAGGTLAGPFDALVNKHAAILPVGPDALPSAPVADGDGILLANGSIQGGISGFLAAMNQSRVDDAGGAVALVSDGVGNLLDGVFDGVDIYDIDGTLTVSGGPGGVGNGTVEVSVLTVCTRQEEDPTLNLFDHPILDEDTLYGEVCADTDTGLVIFR